MIQEAPTLSFSEAFNSFTSKIFQFKGRARRSEYWWTMLLCWGITLVLPAAGSLLSLLTIPLTFRRLHDTGRSGWWWGIGLVLQAVFIVIVFYDIIVMAINGNNPDTFIGDSEEYLIMLVLKYIIYVFVLFVYMLTILVFLCIDSDKGENKYGPSPKYSDDDSLPKQDYTVTMTEHYDKGGYR